MDAKVTWQGQLTFRGTADTGFSVPLGAEVEVGGAEDGFRPLELIATGLAGCTAMDVISILRKKRQDVTAFEVQVHASRAETHPKVFTEAEIEYHVSGREVDEAAVVRAIELSATRYCPAQAMFSKVFPMILKYKIYEEGDDEGRAMVKSGEVRLQAGEQA
ncbi:MAG TPA: OsmC family protein [Anaerolineales bacterium]|nr:OsmC family protein [Anaerolineales bacterium]